MRIAGRSNDRDPGESGKSESMRLGNVTSAQLLCRTTTIAEDAFEDCPVRSRGTGSFNLNVRLKQAASGKLVLARGQHGWRAVRSLLAQICILQFDKGPGGMLQTRQAAGAFSVAKALHGLLELHRQP